MQSIQGAIIITFAMRQLFNKFLYVLTQRFIDRSTNLALLAFIGGKNCSLELP